MTRLKGQRTQGCGLRSRAWWVIRKNRIVTLSELLITLADGQQKAAPNNLRKYLAGLFHAGILGREKTPDGYRYRLVVDLGPKAPLLRNGGGVYDPNNGAMVIAPCPPPSLPPMGGGAGMCLPRAGEGAEPPPSGRGQGEGMAP